MLEPSPTLNAPQQGYLSVGLLHDLCNLLGAAVVQLELARLELGDRGGLSAASEACMQAAELARRLRAGGDGRAQGHASVHDLLAHASGLLAHRFRGAWALRLRLLATDDQVRGDRAALLSSFVNLIMNASEAMPDGGELVIETGGAAMDQGPGLWVRFTDSGRGIPPEVQERIFQPFVSSKDEAGGHGLGLAMVAHAVRAHGGRIEAAPASGRGTAVTLWLPLAA